MLRIRNDMIFYIFDLLLPSAVIHAECFHAATGGNLVESEFGDAKQGMSPGIPCNLKSTRVGVSFE
jgi:hypothetical protein